MIEELNARIAELEKENSKLAAQIGKLEKDIMKLQARVADLEAEIIKLKEKIQQLEAKIRELMEEIDALNEKLKEQEARLATPAKKEAAPKAKSKKVTQLDPDDSDEDGDGAMTAALVLKGTKHDIETYQMMIRRLIADGVLKRHFLLFFDSMRREEWKEFWSKAADCQTFRQMEIMFEALRASPAKLLFNAPNAKILDGAMTATHGVENPLFAKYVRGPEHPSSRSYIGSPARHKAEARSPSPPRPAADKEIDRVLEFAPVYNCWGDASTGDRLLYRRDVGDDPPSSALENASRLSAEQLQSALMTALSDSRIDPRAGLGPSGGVARGRRAPKRFGSSSKLSEAPPGPGLWLPPSEEVAPSVMAGSTRSKWMSETYSGYTSHKQFPNVSERAPVELPPVATSFVRGSFRQTH